MDFCHYTVMFDWIKWHNIFVYIKIGFLKEKVTFHLNIGNRKPSNITTTSTHAYQNILRIQL